MCASLVRFAATVTLLLASVGPALAATFTVDTTTDDPAKTACDDAVADDCSLHGAIIAANALAEASTVDVPAGTYVLTQPATCTFAFKTQGMHTATPVSLCVSGQVTIRGADAATTVIDGNGQHRVLIVGFGAVAEVRGVTLTNGLGEINGGGIDNEGTLRLADSAVNHCKLPEASGGATGGGIYNTDTLTVVRSTVTSNFNNNAGGGGIYNDGFKHGVLTVIDSVISDNTIGANGGGIMNGPGGSIATVTGSTISGNTVTGFAGGGIHNDGTLTLTNSTISGNQSGSSGGGLTNSDSAELNNVTITGNTSGIDHKGRGGGIDNALGTILSLRNTIVAGNTDLAGTPPEPDCDARAGGPFFSALVSQGHNLFGSTAGCDISGDTTGNIIGQDAGLGLLTDNGGPTPTHAPLAGSPVVDAGSPVAPGSGGTACAVVDQRGVLRPVGAACDIGAFERRAEFALSGIVPNRGGNSGSVIVRASGDGFETGATVKLTRGGEEIVGTAPVVEAGNSAITTTFDLAGKPTGAWDVVVTNPDTTVKTLAAGFNIEPGGAPQLWVDVIGPSDIRKRRLERFAIEFGNDGTVDALGVPLTLSIPAQFTVNLHFRTTPPPVQTGQLPHDWQLAPIEVATETAGRINIPLLLPVVPAGDAGTLDVVLIAPAALPEGDINDVFIAAIDQPRFHPILDDATVADFTAAAATYLQDYGGTVTPALAPDLEQYVRDQLQAVVDQGRAQLVASGGAVPVVYSLTQLQMDAAFFVAGQLAAAQASNAPLNVLAAWLGAASFGPMPAEARDQVCPLVSCKSSGLLPEGCPCFDNAPDDLPPIPLPPDCPIKSGTSLKDIIALLSDDKCKPTPGHCTSLPGHSVLHTPGGDYCVPDGPSKHCPRIPITNPIGAGSFDCGARPLRSVGPTDPNDKIGPAGAAPSRFILRGVPLSYVVRFENKPDATAPAQEVVVTDQLDGTKVDFATFRLGAMSFGNITVTPAPGISQYSGGVDLRPAQDLLVLINAGLDEGTGIVTWRFKSVDPDTMEFPEDALAGFLPPNQNPPEGDGSVAFTIDPKPELATGANVCNQASIVFDTNDPIATPQWCNAIDDAPPNSAVQSLAATQPAAQFLVQWGGTDADAGIASYTIFVSANGGPFTPFVIETADTSGMFQGEVGKAYAFFSVARDGVGNVEAAPLTPDAQTTVGPDTGPHDLAVTSIKVPAVKLTAKKPSLAKTIKVQIQNRSPRAETIADAQTLANLVSVTLTSTGNCATPVVTLHDGKPQTKLPVTLKSKKKLLVIFDATFDCANDPAKGAGHEDFQVSARVTSTALGEIDAHPADDQCPRQVTPPGVKDQFPDGKLLDKGCGRKKADKTFGDPVTVDVVDSRTS